MPEHLEAELLSRRPDIVAGRMRAEAASRRIDQAHALASVDESETASAAGLMNFLRTLSVAFATSIATTAWENNTAAAHAELAAQIDRSGETTRRDCSAPAWIWTRSAACWMA